MSTENITEYADLTSADIERIRAARGRQWQGRTGGVRYYINDLADLAGLVGGRERGERISRNRYRNLTERANAVKIWIDEAGEMWVQHNDEEMVLEIRDGLEALAADLA